MIKANKMKKKKKKFLAKLIQTKTRATELHKENTFFSNNTYCQRIVSSRATYGTL